MTSMTGEIEYDVMMQDAMRGLVRSIMEQVRDHGLPGDHHFFISFDTSHPKSVLPEWLLERYPQDITVVIQNWYDNLEVEDETFSITLNFGDTPEHLTIPYEAILTFVDPSVEFGLQFDGQEDQDIPNISAVEEDVEDMVDILEPEEEAPQRDAEIVSLDQFRK